MKFKIPVRFVGPICIAAVLIGIFFITRDNLIAGFCMFAGSFFLERNAYRCPVCGGRLTVRIPTGGGASCPHCHTKL